MNRILSVPTAVLAAVGSSASLAEKVLALKSPASYPHEPDAIESVETHFAWVFLAGAYAYKLKKPRCSDWSDLRLLEARRLNCEDEVRLNRRLTMDWALKIHRQLPSSPTLANEPLGEFDCSAS